MRQGTTSVRRLLTVTLALAGLLAALGCLVVVGDEPAGDGYYRVLGVVAILDVLGTVAVAALVKFGPSDDSTARAAGGRGELRTGRFPPTS